MGKGKHIFGYFIDITRYDQLTHSTLNGLLNSTNDMAIVTAFRAVVTVAAKGAPHVLTSVRTN